MLSGRDDAAQPRRGVRRRALMLAAMALAAIPALMPFDDIVYRAVSGSDLAVIGIMRAITDAGRTGYHLAASAMLALALGIVGQFGTDHRRRRLRAAARLSAFVFFAIAASGTVTAALKVIAGRARPMLHDEAGAWSFDVLNTAYERASFPSGHATSVATLAILAMIAWPGRRGEVAVLALALAVTRVPALAHYPSDVAAGLFVGSAVTLAVARMAAARGVAGLRLDDAALFPSRGEAVSPEQGFSRT